MSETIPVLTPEHHAQLRRQLGDRRLDGTAHVELLTDPESGEAMLGITLGVVGDRALTMLVDSGPTVERIRERIAEFERHVEHDDEDDE